MIHPLGDRVIVRPDKPQDERPSGLIVPSQAVAMPERGTVISVGPGRLSEFHGGLVEPVVVVGDVVYFRRETATIITHPETEKEILVFFSVDLIATDDGIVDAEIVDAEPF